MLKHLLVAGVLALAGYLLLYYGIEHLRTRKGPWEVVFTSVDGVPLLEVHQPALGISNVRICFPGASPKDAAAEPKTVIFRQPQGVPFELPFGTCVFMDTTSLPGSVAMKMYGHEIELLPRTLVIDLKERAWVSGSTINLPASGSETGESSR